MPQSNIQELSLEAVMGERFGRYSKYIIQERALPDIRDGLKPVQRRILYAMYLDKNTHDKAFKKSAKSVGNVMGNFHPHGDSSIYEAMVRLSQPWKVRMPLIEMHGNNGSMDGDPPAAMRYTEARLAQIAEKLLKDIDKETVPMVLNFDDTQKEPMVLPARFPNLLVNGATGISAGYATAIPPHNLREVCQAITYLIDHPQATLADLMKFVSGPDFPTGAILQGKAGIKQAYETGLGKVVVRAKTAIEPLKAGKEQIVISEIPYEVNKAQLVKKIDELRLLKKVDGIGEVRDESDREGLRIVVELKKNAAATGILNYLFKNTDLQITYNFNMVAINHKRPEHVGLKAILQSYIEHQQIVTTKRTKFDLAKAKARQHIVAGLIKALSLLDEVIKTIRASANKADAQRNLVKQFAFSEKQAEAIVALQLYRLTNTDVTALEREAAQLEQTITQLEAILADDAKLNQVIKREITQVAKAYGDDRRTKIEAEITRLKIDEEALVPKEDVMLQISRDGYVKRASLRSYSASGADEAALRNAGLKDADYALVCQQASTRDVVVMFTNLGHMIYRPVHEIMDTKWKDLGEHLSQTVGLDAEEHLIAAYVLPDLTQPATMLLASNGGFVKQTNLADLKPGRTYRSRASVVMKLKQADDRLITAQLLPQNRPATNVFCISRNGLGLQYQLDEVSVIGAKTAGLKAMSLADDDQLVYCHAVEPDAILSLVTDRGAVKRMQAKAVAPTSRGRKGMRVLRELKTKPHHVIFATAAPTAAELVLYGQAGELTHVPLAEHTVADRYSNGSFVVDPSTQGAITSVLVQLPTPPQAD